MPRIIVTADPTVPHSPDTAVLLNEHVHSVHLSTDHAAAQLIERLAWAIEDAESAERARTERLPRPDRPTARSRVGHRARARQAASA